MIQKILLSNFFVSFFTFTAFFIATLFILPQKVSANMTVTGTAYENDIGTRWLKCDGSTQNISIVVNGGGATTTTCSGANGIFSFGSVSMSDGDRVSVFFNTAGGNTDKGVAMILHDDSQTSVDILLNKNEISVLGQGATSVTNTHLGHCNSSAPAGCANVPYSVSGSTLTTEQGTVFTLLSGTDYAPGGNSTFGGGYENYGTSDWDTNTATFNSTSTGNSINTSENFYNLTFNGSGGEWSINTSLNVDNDLTVTAGTVTSFSNIYAKGDVVGNGGLSNTLPSGDHLMDIRQITAGVSHTCAVSNVGNAYCWGSPTNGRLGDGTTSSDKSVPQQVHAGEAVGADTDGTHLVNIAQISSGETHTCAVSNVGNAYCWGQPGNGRLGDETTSGDKSVPQRVHAGEAVGADTDGTHLINIAQISAGWTYTCAVSHAGNTYCWGSPTSGKLGDGTTSTNKTVPQRVHKGEATGNDSDGTHLVNIAQISAGSSHTCAVSHAGNAYCWGQPSFGQLGDGTTTGNKSVPVRVHAGEAVSTDNDGTHLINIVHISVGGIHTCTVSNASNVYCWGRSSDGQLGDGDTSSDKSVPQRVHAGEAVASDTDGTHLTNFAQISTGSYYTCAISHVGNTYCWGDSGNGQLGDTDVWSDKSVPQRVHRSEASGADTNGTHLINIAHISAGNTHTCSLSHVDNVYCWGNGNNGRLGNETTTYSRVPQRVHAGEAVAPETDETHLTNFAQISAGASHTCTLSHTGNVYCWGSASAGQVGDGTTSSKSVPQRVHTGEATGNDSDGTHLINIAQISAGSNHTCALSHSGNVYCWGFAYSGQLGDEDTSSKSVPQRVHAGEATGSDTDGTHLVNIAQISAGSDHTCALSHAGNAYCWGYSGDGRLGDGDTSSSKSAPQRVHAGEATGSDTDGTHLVNIVQISVGSDHTCALSHSGSAYCWGHSTNGQLGDGDTSSDKSVPQRVHAGEASGADTDGTHLINSAQITAGSSYTCALSHEGNAYCWGSSGNGRLGDGTISPNKSVPQRVHAGEATGSDTDGTHLVNIAQISAKSNHTCALSHSSNAYCWGYTSYGQLGDGTTSGDKSVPQRVHAGEAIGSDTDGTHLVNIAQISAGFYHTCAVSHAGNAYCWGSSSGGQLGDWDTSSDKSVPQRTHKGEAFDGTFVENTGNFGGDNDWSFMYLILGDAFSTATTTMQGSGSITIDNTLLVNTNHTLNAGSKIINLNTMTIDGTFSASTSTINYNGTSNTPIAPATYHNLGVGRTSNSTATTYTLTDDTEITGLLTIGNDASSANDTLDIGSNTLTLSGGGIDATTWGVVDADSGTAEYTGTESQTIAPATYLNLSVTADTARTATFISGETYTIPENGTVTFTGSSGQLLTLAPSSASAWDFNVDETNTTVTVEDISVSYSDASGGIEIDAESETNVDGGNNTNWKLPIPPVPTKVVFTSTPRSFVVGTCNGLAKAFTIQLQDDGDTVRTPTDTTVIRISSNSPSYTIYSDSDCTSEATNGDFTFTTEEHTKSVYIIDQNVALINRTLTATRQSGDTLTSGTQDYTVTEVPTEVRIKGNLRIEGDMRFR